MRLLERYKTWLSSNRTWRAGKSFPISLRLNLVAPRSNWLVRRVGLRGSVALIWRTYGRLIDHWLGESGDFQDCFHTVHHWRTSFFSNTHPSRVKQIFVRHRVTQSVYIAIDKFSSSFPELYWSQKEGGCIGAVSVLRTRHLKISHQLPPSSRRCPHTALIDAKSCNITFNRNWNSDKAKAHFKSSPSTTARHSSFEAVKMKYSRVNK